MASKIVEIFVYMRKCPKLSDLWSIAGVEDVDVSVILPQGASAKRQYLDSTDITDNYECEIVPYDRFYEDYQINCYKAYDAKDNSSPESNINVLNFDEVQKICDWVAEQDEALNLPKITGESVVAIECNPHIPQIRFVNPEENIIGYFITVRIHFKNKAKRSVRYGN